MLSNDKTLKKNALKQLSIHRIDSIRISSYSFQGNRRIQFLIGRRMHLIELSLSTNDFPRSLSSVRTDILVKNTEKELEAESDFFDRTSIWPRRERWYQSFLFLVAVVVVVFFFCLSRWSLIASILLPSICGLGKRSLLFAFVLSVSLSRSSFPLCALKEKRPVSSCYCCCCCSFLCCCFSFLSYKYVNQAREAKVERLFIEWHRWELANVCMIPPNDADAWWRTASGRSCSSSPVSHLCLHVEVWFISWFFQFAQTTDIDIQAARNIDLRA